jgi:hypothetical protein
VPKYLRARAPHDDREARKIRRLAGARHAPADWIERARIVTLSWDGLAVPAIAARTGRHENTVRRWLHRFNAAGLDGLGSQPGAGRADDQRGAAVGHHRHGPLTAARAAGPRRRRGTVRRR